MRKFFMIITFLFTLIFCAFSIPAQATPIGDHPQANIPDQQGIVQLPGMQITASLTITHADAWIAGTQTRPWPFCAHGFDPRYNPHCRYDPNEQFYEHYDGHTWKVVSLDETMTYGTIVSMSASSGHDVWAVGKEQTTADVLAVTQHWDGTKWMAIGYGSLDLGTSLYTGVADYYSTKVKAYAPNFVLVFGYQAIVYKPTGAVSLIRTINMWNGKQWTNVVPGDAAL